MAQSAPRTDTVTERASRSDGECSTAPMCAELLGTSAAVREASALVAAAATDRRPVLIVAEKGLSAVAVARAIHEQGTDNDAFVSFDCADAPSSDIARELFGAVRGASARRASELESVGADSLLGGGRPGTVVLAQIAELPAPAQAKLARILRDGEVAVGRAGTARAITVRVVGSVGAEPETAVEEGRLRADLYRRLAQHLIEVPPLRQRTADVEPIAVAVASEVARASGRPRPGFTQMAIKLLTACPWRGNIDELRGLLERVTPTGVGELIQIEDLLAHVRLDGAPPPIQPNGPLREAKRRFEREYVAAVLRRHGWRMADAARALGLQRTNLYRKVRQLGVLNKGSRDGTTSERR